MADGGGGEGGRLEGEGGSCHYLLVSAVKADD